MRIAYLCCDPGVPVSGTNGASLQLRAVVHSLRRIGHTVRVFSINPGDGTDDTDEDVHAVRLGGFASESARLLDLDETGAAPHLKSEFRRLLHAEYAQRALLPVLAAFRPDAIYELYSLFAYAGVELARELDIPLVLEVNAPLAIESAKHRGLVLTRAAAEMERRIFVAAAALVVVSNELARYARDLGVPAERITVLPNGVDTRRFDPTVSGADVRRVHGLEGKRVIGFVGNRRPWHDLGTLLAAVKLLASHDASIRLFLVGQSFEREQSEGGDLVRAVHVAADDVPKCLAAMDVVVVPYAKDADIYFSPLKLYEAMAMARPIVGAAVGQVCEVLTHGRNGLVYEPSNVDDLAARIADIFGRPDRGASLGAAAYQDIVSTNTWEERSRRIVAIASKLTAQAAAAGKPLGGMTCWR